MKLGLPSSSTLHNILVKDHPKVTEALLSKEKCCSICGRKTAGGKGTWHVDHDHKTKRFRGLLCHCCNLGLGHFQDSIKLLIKAIDYLKESEK
ncbi:MAG TPA: endonuclease domain-containing protein [Chitinophagaceae bacterium]|jgi:hypothetical protein